MKRYLAFSWVLLLAGLWCISQSSAFWQSRGSNYNVSSGAGGGGCSYTGPGNILAAQAWYGLRSYSSSTCGNAAVNVCYDLAGSDVLCQDFVTSSTTGALILATISGQSCASVTCTIKIIYDQSGANLCSSAPCNMTQTTVANRQTLTANCVGGTLPCGSSSTTAMAYAAGTNSLSTSQPFLVASYSQNVVSNYGATTYSSCYGLSGMYYGTASDTKYMYAGSGPATVTATHGSFHAAAAIFNGSSSSINLDGTVTGSLNPGSTGYASSSTGPQMFGGTGAAYWTECGFWSSSSTTARDSLESNIAGYW